MDPLTRDTQAPATAGQLRLSAANSGQVPQHVLRRGNPRRRGLQGQQRQVVDHLKLFRLLGVQGRDLGPTEISGQDGGLDGRLPGGGISEPCVTGHLPVGFSKCLCFGSGKLLLAEEPIAIHLREFVKLIGDRLGRRFNLRYLRPVVRLLRGVVRGRGAGSCRLPDGLQGVDRHHASRTDVFRPLSAVPVPKLAAAKGVGIPHRDRT